MTDTLSRCDWCGEDPLYQAYHDAEWGNPCFNADTLFELMVLESFQAGLSWITILRKREGFRKAFADFDVTKIASFSQQDIARLLGNSAIVRHRGKIEATIANAQAFLDVQETQSGGFAALIWDHVEGAPRVNHWKSLADVPAQTPEAQNMAKRLKSLGFRFMGPTTCYAFMQAAGLVNDHLLSCFCHPDNRSDKA